MSIKIAYLISHPIQHFCPMFKELAKSDQWELKVFFASAAGSKTYYDPNFKKEVKWDGLYLDQFPHIFLNEDNVNSSSALDAPNVTFELEKFEPSVLVILGYNQKYQRRAMLWAKNKEKKVLMFSDSELRQPRPFYKKVLKKIVLPYWLNKVDAFLTTGNANEEYYQYYGVPPVKFFRSAYPIDSELYESAYKNNENLRKKVRKQLHLSDDDIVCTVVGKFVPWKNQIDLINALEFVKNKSIKVLLVGSGELDSVLKAAASKYKGQVLFSGFIPAHDLPEYYSATDIYVHPSRKEPHSVAISEASYMGCPIVVSNTSGSYGTADDVRPGVNGFVYENGNLQQLAFLLEKLASLELRQYFSAASREYAVRAQMTSKGSGLSAALLALNLL